MQSSPLHWAADLLLDHAREDALIASAYLDDHCQSIERLENILGKRQPQIKAVSMYMYQLARQLQFHPFEKAPCICDDVLSFLHHDGSKLRGPPGMAFAVARVSTIRPTFSKAPTLGTDSTSSKIISINKNPELLREQTRWIRDVLDQQVARDGPDSLHADDILKLDELIRQLHDADLDVKDIRYSRIHLAILEISGRATRWPNVLIERCDAVAQIWEQKFGNLQNLGTLLYEDGGRLHGVCTPGDTSKDRLMIRWMKAKEIRAFAAHSWGDLGFKPGDWWINPLFAHRDGIIDRSENEGGIVADAHGAYAVLLAGDEEVCSASPNEFVYRARHSHGGGRYRLTAATRESRKPVRILRSHTLRSFWTPKAGVRYDGLHKVTGWSIHEDRKTKEMVYDITFLRLPTEPSMEDVVLCRPWTEEVEDYKQYKRLRQLARDDQNRAAEQEKSENMPTIPVAITDGIYEYDHDQLESVSPKTVPADFEAAADDLEEGLRRLPMFDDSPGASMVDLLEVASQYDIASPATPPHAPMMAKRSSLTSLHFTGINWRSG